MRLILDHVLAKHPPTFSSLDVSFVLPKLFTNESFHESLVRYLDSRMFSLKLVTGEDRRIKTFDLGMIQAKLAQLDSFT